MNKDLDTFILEMPLPAAEDPEIPSFGMKIAAEVLAKPRKTKDSMFQWLADEADESDDIK